MRVRVEEHIKPVVQTRFYYFISYLLTVVYCFYDVSSTIILYFLRFSHDQIELLVSRDKMT
jgi:hypothetical protein